MKVLCVCQKGNSRSVAFAYLLKKKYCIDALACGFITQSEETLEMLFNWADKIILMAPQYKNKIPEQWRSKLSILDVGHDIYFKGFDENLLKQCQNHVKELYS